MSNILKTINTVMTDCDLNYSYGVYKQGVKLPCVIGKFNDNGNAEEDSVYLGEMLLTFIGNNSYKELEDMKETLIDNLSSTGKVFNYDDGSLVVIYKQSFPIPTQEEELVRMQVNLAITEWRIK